MDARDHRRAGRERRERHLRCPVCGGDLKVLVEVPAHGQPHEQDHPSTRYFHCTSCGQIQIIDE